jgi:hypothetical protein
MTKLSTLLTSGLRIIATNTYLANDTWTKPAGAVLVRVVMCGGGGSGRRPAANAAASAGGSGAPIVEMTFPAAGLGPTESVVVGAGGAAVTVTATNGNDGGYSAFGKLEAAGGTGGTNTNTPPFTLWHPSIGAASTAANRAANIAPGGSNTSFGYDGAIGIIGGAGGYVGANNSAVGGAGGGSNRYRTGAGSAATATSGTGGTSGGATGGNGGTGANGEIRIGLGGEGGGSGGGGSTTGGNGGAGGVPGGGGGAGGFGTTTSGNSGAGGAGAVYVETWG